MQSMTKPSKSSGVHPALKGEEEIGEMEDMKGEEFDFSNKEQLKVAMKEVAMEKDMQYSVEHKSKEELECLIKLAQTQIKKLHDNPTKDSPSTLSKY